MTAAQFYRLVLRLWGEDWRPELRRLLEGNGLSFCRQTFWHWQTGQRKVDQRVAELLQAEKNRLKPKRPLSPQRRSS